MDVIPILSGVLSGVIAGAVAWGGMRAEIKGMRNDLERLYHGNEKAHARLDEQNTRIAHLEGRRRRG